MLPSSENIILKNSLITL